MILVWSLVTFTVCLSSFILGHATGFVVGFRKAAADPVVEKLDKLTETLLNLDTALEQESDLVLVSLKDETSEPVN
jgi:hypothetical protein